MIEATETRSEQLQRWLNQAEQLMVTLRHRLANEQVAEYRVALEKRIDELTTDIEDAERQWVQLTVPKYSGTNVAMHLYILLTVRHMEAGNFTLALASCNHAILQSTSPFILPYKKRAEIYAYMGLWQEALDDYQQFEASSDESTLIGKAIVLYHLDRLKEAENQFLLAKSAAERENNIVDQLLALNYLGIIATSTEQIEKALQYYDSAVTIGETTKELIDLSQLYYSRARLQVMQGKDSEAFRNYERAIDFAPNNADIYQDLALLCLKQHNWRRAEDYQKKALELAPRRSDFLINMGALQIKQRNYEEARDTYHQSLEQGRSEPVVYNSLGICEAALGNFATAEDAFRQAIKLDNQNYQSRACLGMILFQQGKFKAAIDAYEEALIMVRSIGNQRDESIILDQQAGSYFRLSRYSEALTCYSHAREIKHSLESQIEEIELTTFGSPHIDLQECVKALAHYQRESANDQEGAEYWGVEFILSNLFNNYCRLREHTESIPSLGLAFNAVHKIKESQKTEQIPLHLAVGHLSSKVDPIFPGLPKVFPPSITWGAPAIAWKITKDMPTPMNTEYHSGDQGLSSWEP